jgi:uracil-DNA glycosylase family 4
MLSKPASCGGCPLAPLSTGFMKPQIASNPYGVTLVGEALGQDEAEQGKPFVGKAGFRLSRLIEWAGLDRSRFDILNTGGNAL